MNEQDIKQAMDHLADRDPVLATLIKKLEEKGRLPQPSHPGDPFNSLVRTIIGQQLSVKAANTIYHRLNESLSLNVKPSKLIKSSPEDLRMIGISKTKGRCIIQLAQAVESNALSFGMLYTMTDEDVIAQLIKIKGIGNWTANMFCIGPLGRPDIFPKKDGGIIRAMRLAYGQDDTGMRHAAISDNWRPYRSVASRILWRALDNGVL